MDKNPETPDPKEKQKPLEKLKKALKRNKKNHKGCRPCGAGVGSWLFVGERDGELVVRCSFCDYSMRINTKTKKLEHFSNPCKALMFSVLWSEEIKNARKTLADSEDKKT